jgi:hypothetical protein
MILTLALALAAPRAARAWNATGHMTVAALAHAQLSSHTRQRLVALLQHHPDYATWRSQLPGGTDPSLYLLMRAATWPDDIRRTGSPYDHPNWHFVDYPLRPPAFPMEGRPKPDDDILFALERCDRVLRDTKRPAAERAAYLCWLVHLIGDIHQPLHCGSLFDARFPEGDRGGNLLFVSVSDGPIPLHRFWDNLLGENQEPAAILTLASSLRADSSLARAQLPELAQDRTPVSWSLETRSEAINWAYLRGTLQAAAATLTPEGRTRPPETAPALPESYQQHARALANRRIVLAGDRLADTLTGLFPA